jgi:hypothetical protein
LEFSPVQDSRSFCGCRRKANPLMAKLMQHAFFLLLPDDSENSIGIKIFWQYLSTPFFKRWELKKKKGGQI